MEAVKKVKVEKGLHSFLTEIARCTKTSGCHYSIIEDNRKIEIYHHNYKWAVKITPKRIVIMTNEDILVIDETMKLNGQEVNAICDTVRCYSREDIVFLIIASIAIYNRHWLAVWI